MLLPFSTVVLFISTASSGFNITSLPPTPNPLSKPLGINCRGSSLCPTFLEPSSLDYIGTLRSILAGFERHCPNRFSCGPMHDDAIYETGDHIACLPLGQSFLGGICAFTQGDSVPPEGTTGKVLKQRLKELWGHGCRVCGSVPLSGDNDPRVEGWLTVNYVGGVVCPGLCPPRHYEGAVGLVGGEGNKSLLPVGQIES